MLKCPHPVCRKSHESSDYGLPKLYYFISSLRSYTSRHYSGKRSYNDERVTSHFIRWISLARTIGGSQTADGKAPGPASIAFQAMTFSWNHSQYLISCVYPLSLNGRIEKAYDFEPTIQMQLHRLIPGPDVFSGMSILRYSLYLRLTSLIPELIEDRDTYLAAASEIDQHRHGFQLPLLSR